MPRVPSQLLPLDLQEQLTAALAQAGGLSTQVRDLELALAQSQAKWAQQGIVAELRTYLVASERPTARQTR